MTEGNLGHSAKGKSNQCRTQNNMSKVNTNQSSDRDGICSSSLSFTGYVWAFLSLLCVIAISLGFFMPFWLQGQMSSQFNNTISYLGIFRRCHYPAIAGDSGQLVMVSQCGHYTHFSDIPSVWWQVTTVLIGIAACLSFVIALTALLAACLDDVLTKTSACILGGVQFMAGKKSLLVDILAAFSDYQWKHLTFRHV